MKSFKEYLTESKKIYEFKIKIAGEIPKDTAGIIKAALSQFQVESCNQGKRTPIQERQSDFPELENINVTLFDVNTSYPTTSLQVRNKIAEALQLPHSLIIVRNLAEEKELEINHQNDDKSGESLLSKDYEASNNQKFVGEKQVMSLLKELNKTKKEGEQYKGVNDELLANGAPKSVKEKPGKQVETKTKFVNLFTKTTHVDPVKGTSK